MTRTKRQKRAFSEVVVFFSLLSPSLALTTCRRPIASRSATTTTQNEKYTQLVVDTSVGGEASSGNKASGTGTKAAGFFLACCRPSPPQFLCLLSPRGLDQRPHKTYFDTHLAGDRFTITAINLCRENCPTNKSVGSCIYDAELCFWSITRMSSNDRLHRKK